MSGALSVAAATLVPFAAQASEQPSTVFVMELLPPPGRHSSTWSGFVMDEHGHRWAFAANRAGELVHAFREDRGCVLEDGRAFWSAMEEPNSDVREAVRAAVLAQTDNLSRGSEILDLAAEIRRIHSEAEEIAADASDDYEDRLYAFYTDPASPGHKDKGLSSKERIAIFNSDPQNAKDSETLTRADNHHQVADKLESRFFNLIARTPEERRAQYDMLVSLHWGGDADWTKSREEGPPDNYQMQLISKLLADFCGAPASPTG